MTRASSIAYSALFLVVVVTVWDLYRLFVPDLSGSFDTPRLKPSGIKGDSYSWKVCLSESAEEITHQALATECVMDMKYIRFDEKTNWQKNVTLPSHYLLKFARQHGEYQRTHQEYVRLSHELEEARLLQQRHSQTNRQREAKDPDAIIAAAATQQSNVSTLSSLIIQLDRQRDELIRLRQTIRSSGLYLHHFFWRSTFHDPFSDSFHVHTSTPLLIRIVERRNTSRNLLASSTDGTDVKSVSGVNSSHRPSSELWYQFRRTHPFQFIYDGLTFPVSHIPPELHAFFPQNEIRKKNGGLYKPLIIEQPFFVLRKHWKRLGDETFIRACMTKEGADDEDEEHHHTRQSKRVHVNDEEYDRDDDDGADEISFSTIPTTTPGVSDEVFVSRLETAVSEFLASGGHQLTFQLQASSLGYYRLLASMAESSDLIALMTQTGNEVVDQQIASLTALSPSSLSSSIAHTKLQSLKLHTDLVSHATLGEDVSIDAEQLKELWSESNPWLIGLTTLIGGIHLLFDLLAVKNDIGFFRQTAKKNDFAGISAKSIWAHTIMRTIIFLYLLDDDNTSRMVLVSVALGLGVSYWKSIQLLRIKFEITNRFPFLLTFASHSQSAGERKTNEYDAKALRFLGWASIPFIGGCTIYSLIYQTHKSWYSFVLSSFALSIYIGGFISMTPQLYVNYRLKTVAHMPLRVFIYRACNTFIGPSQKENNFYGPNKQKCTIAKASLFTLILYSCSPLLSSSLSSDDLFAWLLSMPTLHRVATLRDDIIFFIYLYQRWIYPTDKTRNLKFDDEEEEEEEEVKENGSGSRSLPPIHAKPPKTDRSSAPPPTPSFPSSLTSPSSSSSRATGGVVELVDSSAASPKLTRRHQAHNGNEKKD